MHTQPSAFIEQMSFSGGATFTLEPKDKVILVGPNNSGKSQSLREILTMCKTGKALRPQVVTDIQIAKLGNESELREFLDQHAELVGNAYRYRDWEVPEGHLKFWNNPYLIHGLTEGFVRRISADERLMICQQQSNISPGEQKSKPQHVLYDSEAMMNKISGLFRRAFGKDLMFDFRGGSKMPIHVGDRPCFDGPIDRVGDAYVAAVRENPLLDRQGDGMKSYAGILFEAVVATRDITLIDEPEAFLHPPQMRRLGETLASEVSGQLIVATHSSDIMRGFLEGTRGSVRILRILRRGDVNVVVEAPTDTIKELWDKPELRYSNALESIFHEQTIICEDDSDCRLMNSIADHLALVNSVSDSDTAYVPTGGKHGIPKIANVLRQVGVPIKAIFDIDFFSDRALVKSTVEAFGGRWDDYDSLWSRLDAAVRKGEKLKTIKEIKSDIVAAIDSSADDELPRGDIIELMKQNKPWSAVKSYGSTAIPKGDAQKTYLALRDKLEEIGIYVIPVGEMENFCPDIGSHGPKFVTKLLATVPLSDDRLQELRSFVAKVQKGKHGLLP